MRLEIDSDRRLQALYPCDRPPCRRARRPMGRIRGKPSPKLDALGLLADPPVRAGANAVAACLACRGRPWRSERRAYLRGHVNACWLIEDTAPPPKRKPLQGKSQEKAGLFGVWNTDAPDDPLRLVGGKLVGRKKKFRHRRRGHVACGRDHHRGRRSAQ